MKYPFLLLLLVGSILFAGCNNAQNKIKMPPIRAGFVGELSVLFAIAQVQGEDNADMRVFAFDREAIDVGSTVPHEPADITSIEVKIRRLGKPKKGGTYFTPMLTKMLNLAQKSKVPVYIYVLTDGGVDDRKALRDSKILERIYNCSAIKKVYFGPVASDSLTDLTDRTSDLAEKCKIFSSVDIANLTEEIATLQKNDGGNRQVLVCVDRSGSIDTNTTVQ